MDNAGHASTDRRSSNPLGCDKETQMNSIQRFAFPAVAVLSLAAAGTAFAGTTYHGDAAVISPAAQSTVTRAQVQAELVQARADGSMKVWSSSYNPFAAVKSVKTRAEVRAEAVAARSADLGYGEDSGSFALATQPASTQAGAVYATSR